MNETLIANLTHDPELRYVSNGKAVVDLRLVHNPRVRNAGGEWVDGEPVYFIGTVWEQQAENAAASLSRGDRVVVTGTRHSEEYTDRTTGEIRTSRRMKVHELAVSIRFATARPQKAERRQDAADDSWTAATNTVSSILGGTVEQPAY